MPSDTFSHTVTVSATPESIYSALQHPDTWRGIGPIDDVWDATHEGDRLAGFKWSTRAAGKSWEGTARRGTDRAAGEHRWLAVERRRWSGALLIDVVQIHHA